MSLLTGLLMASPFAVLVILLQLMATTAFLPYKVDRPMNHVPYVTYGLIGTNVVIFLLTVFIANINLPYDKEAGSTAIETLLSKDKSGLSALPAAPAAGGDARAQEQVRQLLFRVRQNQALRLASKEAKTREGFEQMYRISHADSSYVLEPHPSVLNVFAYRAAEPSFGLKLLGLLGSMFLHGGIMHIAGNMLYLWVFGRATEESLGSKLYAGAYLLCGIAAVLVFHAATLQFAPTQAAVPYLGASGAIAGVQGFFAMRFYRTPVNIFYIQPLSLLIVFVAASIAGVIGAIFLGSIGALAAFFAVWIAFVIYMRKLAFGTFKIASAWAIGIWLIVFNIFPAVSEIVGGQQGGVAFWAHIGGFLFGMLYATLIGSKEEGGKEYMLEDAQKAYESGDMAGALDYSQNLLEREPHNAGAYDILARAHAAQDNEDGALDNYELAIEHYLRGGAREKAAEAYLYALKKYPGFILPPDKQLAVGNQMAKDEDWQNAAETLVKIPYTFPDAPEGEMALLRASQVYLEQLSQPQMTLQLLEHFSQTYPQSQWMPQVQRAYKIANFQLAPPDEPEAGAQG